MKPSAGVLAVFCCTLLASWVPLFARQEEKQPELLKTLKRKDPPDADSAFNGIALSPDGKKVAAAGRDGSVTLWDIKTEAEQTLKKGAPIKPGSSLAMNAVVFSHDSKVLLAGSDSEGLWMWSVASGKLLFKTATPGSIVSLSASSDGALLAVGSTLGFKVLKRDTLQELASFLYGLEGPKEWLDPPNVAPVAFTLDGKRLAAGSGPQGIKLWDSKTLKDVKSYEPTGTGMLRSISFSKGARFFATGGDDAEIRIWDTVTGNVLKSWTCPDKPVISVLFHPNRDTLYTANASHTVRCWKIATGDELWKLSADRGIGQFLSISTDGATLAAGAFDVHVYTLPAPKDPPKPVTKFEPPGPKARADGVFVLNRPLGSAIAVSPDGKTLALMDGLNVLLYDPETFKELRTLSAFRSAPTGSMVADKLHGLAFSPDSKMLLAFKADPTYGIYPVWEVASGKLVGRLRAMKLQTDCVGWSPTGKEIVAAGLDGNQGDFEAKVKFWSAELVNGLISTESSRSIKPHGSLEDTVLDASGTRIFLSVSEKGYEIADAVTGEVLERVDDRNQMRNSAYKFVLSPNGKFLAVATGKMGPLNAKSFPGLLCVWDLEKKAVKFEALQGENMARYTAWSPDGKIVAVSAMGSGLNLYDVETGQLIRSVDGGESFAFTGDSQWILEPNHQGLRAWQVKKP